MIHSLLPALIQDVLEFLKQDPTFLSLGQSEREQKAPAMAALLAGMGEPQFMADLQVTLQVLKGSASPAKSQLMKSLGEYFVKDFPIIFDQLDRHFHQLSQDQQRQRLKELIPEKHRFFAELRSLLLNTSSQEMEEILGNFLRTVFDAPLVVVQSPLECSPQIKKEIRSQFFDQYPESFVLFQINPQLIGGIRFFVNGNVQDHSWFGRIADIRRLHHLVG